MIVTLGASIIVVGCGSDGFGGSAAPTLAPTSIQPTFVRVTVTPAPTETPTPTPLPTATLEPQVIDFGPPEFPLAFDPELVEERPTDAEILEAWSRYVRNTSLVHDFADVPLELCSGGLVLVNDQPHEFIQNWRIVRSPAIGRYDWGVVQIEIDIVGGNWAGRKWSIATLSRFEGKVWVTNTPSTTEALITRSQICIDRIT